jgi:molybdate transport system substrate-binding protein
MRRIPAAAVLAFVLLSGCAPSPSTASTRVVRVAAAADLKFALEEVRTEFERTHPSVQMEVSYGSSGNWFAQLSNRAPFDLFLSADMDYPHRLVEQNLAERESEFVYAVGHLVVWVPKDSPLDLERLGIQAVVDPTVRKIAVANPKHAPYGRAAEAALKKFGVHEQVKDRLVLGENVAQTAQFTETGSADIGLFALSLALAPTLREKGRYWEVPLDAYPRLDQGGVILSWAQDREAAAAVRSFLMSTEGKAVLRRYGFFLPGE